MSSPTAAAAPSLADLTPLAAQVAGHDGVLSLCGGSLVFKPAKSSEVAFYSSLSSLPSSLLPFLPAFHGALPLPDPKPEKEETHGVVLENLAAGFKRPNILDVKLGTQLWDEGASAEKRERMEKQSKESTSGSDGVRLTGWRIFDNTSSSTSSSSASSSPAAAAAAAVAADDADEEAYMSMPKAFGKAITSASLALGMRHFFASSLPSDGASIADILSSSGPSSSSSEPRTPTRTRTAHLPSRTIAALLAHGFLPRLLQLRHELESVEWRMRGGSVLLVYEGEEQTLVERVEEARKSGRWETMRVRPAAAACAAATTKEEAHESSSSSSSSSEPAPKAVFDIRLIDFAHVTLVPGQGPDEGVLKGLDTTIRLLQELLERLEGEGERER